MPARPRKQIINDDEVGVYHCYNRCVRRAFLCGDDPVSGKNFDHRKEWIRLRLELFASAFAIEICDFAVLDNHFHVILRNRPDIAKELSDPEVALRWWRLCPTRRDEQGEAADPTTEELDEWLKDAETMKELRGRLHSISWFMRLMCQRIASRANREDDIRGKFWESRFSSQALLDEQAILTCSMYVDLNVIRAGKADTPEASQYTSIYERIAAWRARLGGSPTPATPGHVGMGPHDATESGLWLVPIELADAASVPDAASGAEVCGAATSQANPFPSPRLTNKGFLPITFEQYLELLDWTGRQIRSDKRGSIPANLAGILDRLHINSSTWLDVMCDFAKRFHTAVGRVESLVKYAQGLGSRWLSGIRQAAAAFT